MLFNLRRFSRTFFTLVSSQYALMLEYRAEIALWALSGILPLIMLAIWSNIDLPNSFEFDSDFISKYFVSAFIIRQFTAVWVMVTFEQDHIEGKLSPYLLHPITPYWRYFSSHIAEQLTRIPFVVILLTLLFVFSPDLFWMPKLSTIIITIPVIFLSFLIRFLLHWIFAMLCFYNDRAASFEKLLLIPYLFLSGMVAPLDSFPALVKSIALLTPFPYVLSFPCLLLSGGDTHILSSIVVQLFWIILFILISILCWKKSIKHYSAMGA